MSRAPTSQATTRPRFPRVSGDEPLNKEKDNEHLPFSPRERG